MNADAFRHFYDYHFAENRNLWESYIAPLSDEQFTQAVDYSHGSLRDQIAHLVNVDFGWFSDLRGVEISEPIIGDDVDDRDQIRTHWDEVEQQMRGYLGALQDEMLDDRPLSGEDENLLLWQILLHVANHGTDHRAQILRLLNDLGVKTVSQDYIFYVYDNP